jgi:hypothetical protein
MMASRRPACAEPHTSLSRRRCWPLRSRMHDTRSHCSDTRSRSGTLSSGADAVCSADPPPSRAHRQPAASKRRPSIMLKTVRGPRMWERRLPVGRGSCGCAGSARQLRARRCHGVSADAGLKNRGACARSAACRPCGGPDASCAPALRVRAEHSPVGADARPRPRHLHRKVPSLPRTVPPCRFCAQRRPRLRACWQRLAAHASVGDGSDLVDLSDLGTISVGDLGSRGAAILKDDAYSCGCVRACVRAFAFVFVFEFAFVFACVRRANRSARQARCYVNDAPAHAHANAHTSAQTTS